MGADSCYYCLFHGEKNIINAFVMHMMQKAGFLLVEIAFANTTSERRIVVIYVRAIYDLCNISSHCISNTEIHGCLC